MVRLPFSFHSPKHFIISTKSPKWQTLVAAQQVPSKLSIHSPLSHHQSSFTKQLANMLSTGRQTSRSTTTRATPSPLRRHRPCRYNEIRVDFQHPTRQLRKLCGTSAYAELYGYWYGRVQREGASADGGEDDTACWEAAGGAGLREVARVGGCYGVWENGNKGLSGSIPLGGTCIRWRRGSALISHSAATIF
jgi:hypothetical protein